MKERDSQSLTMSGRPIETAADAHWLAEAVELMTSLAEEVHFADAMHADEAAFAAARTALKQLDFLATAFAVPDLDGLDFHLRLCDPPARRANMEAELAFQISQGRFGWALRQNRPVLLATREADCSLLLQPLATRSRVIGVFLGVIDDDFPVIPASYRRLVSLAFFHFASVIECTQQSHQLQVTKELLAKRSEQRDTRLHDAKDLLAADHRQATRMLEELGHELQTSASGIAGMASRLQQGDLASAERDAADGIAKHASRIAATLGDLATWCRLDSGSFELTRRDFDPAQAVAAVQHDLDERAREEGIKLVSRVDPELPRLLRGDPDRLHQILSILAGAAVAESEGGEVSLHAYELSSSEHSAVIRFEVHATGAQLDPTVADHFFEPFGKERLRTRHPEESGLRLALCRRLVEDMQGQLGAVARPGKGTRFWCNLQLATATGETTAPEDTPTSDASALEVLLICHEGANADRLEKAVQRRGHRVTRHPADSDLPDPKHADILILGSTVDGGPWAHMCRRIRRQPGGKDPVILALAHPEDVEGMLDAGADDCVLDSMAADVLDTRIAVAERMARRSKRKELEKH